MTVVVGILNKEAVAIAADSAATIPSGNGEPAKKIFNSIDKIFHLSDSQPVGLAIFGMGQFCRLVPYDTVVKMYRQRLGNKSFATMDKYVDDFLKFLNSFALNYSIDVENLGENGAGMAFFGFGSEEMLPVLIEERLRLRKDGTMEFVRKKVCEVSCEPGHQAFIHPMAQPDVVKSVTTGINPTLLERIGDAVADIIDFAIDDFLDQNQDAFESLRDRFDDLRESWEKENLEGIKEGFYDSLEDIRNSEEAEILSTVVNMKKPQLAKLAENFVYQTSLNRKVIPDSDETVGGPIDVAVVSKGDGFIWIKRKMYYKPELNGE